MQSQYDLVVIGAGINGAGIARDASMRGLKVLLLDKADVASGTSSWSTRLIHGGLRYLEHGELGLVRESLREREYLLRIAPHLVRPIPILIPVYKNGGRRSGIIRAGLLAYDLLSFDKTLPSHRFLTSAQTLQRVPGLNSIGLTGGALYYDCQAEFPERLVLENVLSATISGAQVSTYSQVIKIADSSVEFLCEGAPQVATSKVVVNAAGPWVDQLINGNNSQPLIGGTKGSHIVVRSFCGAPQDALYIEAQSDRRPFFVIPWNQNYLIGTTDVRFNEDPDVVRSETWEVEYLLNETNHVFPDAGLTKDSICYSYSGIRPLPFTREDDERSITRRHFIREDPQIKTLLSIVGGKLTTYRSLSEECVDIVFRKLGKKAQRSRTREVALPGAIDLAEVQRKLKASRRFSPSVTGRLGRIYGSRATDLMKLCDVHPQLSETFNTSGDAIAAEIVFAFRSELATTLSDCLLRRLMIGLNCDLSVGDDESAALIGRRFLGWTEERALGEVLRYRNQIERLRTLQT